MKKHQKHSKLAKPTMGMYARNEWAILGAPCEFIHQFSKLLSDYFQQHLKVSYLDASHKEEHLSGKAFSDHSFHLDAEEQGAAMKIQFTEKPNSFGFKRLFQTSDLVLVNGNHFKAQQQIVILNPKKRDSLSRKVDRLTDVILVLKHGIDEIPDFLKDKVVGVPVLQITETEKILHHLQSQIQKPPIYGLIMNGGKSTRMGTDKSAIQYHGQTQLDYLQDLLHEHCEKTFVSVAHEKDKPPYETITDKFIGLGAYSGILSAFQQHPNAVWLVVAIDMPNVDHHSIQQLIQQRNTSKVATAFLNPATQFPDPLFTIFEPKAYPLLLNYLSLGYACPRKMLINEDIQLIQSDNKDLLLNINTPEEKNHFLNG